MPQWVDRTPKWIVVAAVTACMLGAGASAAAADSGAAASASRAKGKIHKAWPHKKDGRKPHKRLARKLAKQIGPIRVGKRHRLATTTRAEARATTPASPDVVDTGQSGEGRLLLVRSFDIPKDDPLYADLSNYSWTYDNALATIGFVADKDQSPARQLLDQLSALQNGDGSFNFAFDVMSGDSSKVVRSGAVAWVGLAGTAYAEKYGGDTYDKMIAGTLEYLLKLRNSDGLIRGGPDVSWVSTQHNLLASELLREAEQLSGSHKFGSFTAKSLKAARVDLNTAINKQLLVSEGATAHFREGQGDPRIPIDVQALGTLYLDSLTNPLATKVGAFILEPGFYVPPRVTEAAPEELSGLKPFLDPGSPDLIWSEGTIESQFALTRIGQPKTYVKAAVDSLAATMQPDTVGPIGADRQSNTSWGDYQTWPTSAAASWLLMLQLEGDVTLFD